MPTQWPGRGPAGDPEGDGRTLGRAAGAGAGWATRSSSGWWPRCCRGSTPATPTELSVAAGAAQLAAAARRGPSLVHGLRRAAAGRARGRRRPARPGVPRHPGRHPDPHRPAARPAHDGRGRRCTGPARSTALRRGTDTAWIVHTPARTPRGRPGGAQHARARHRPAPRPLGPTWPRGWASSSTPRSPWSTLAVARSALDSSARRQRLPGCATAIACPLSPPARGRRPSGPTSTTPTWPCCGVSAGRHGDTRALDLDDDELVAALAADLATTMGLSAPADRLAGDPLVRRPAPVPPGPPRPGPGLAPACRRCGTGRRPGRRGLRRTGAAGLHPPGSPSRPGRARRRDLTSPPAVRPPWPPYLPSGRALLHSEPEAANIP